MASKIDSVAALLLFDAILFLILLGMLWYHIRFTRKERQKTEEIREDLSQEHEKTKKFHVSLEEIRNMTKD